MKRPHAIFGAALLLTPPACAPGDAASPDDPSISTSLNFDTTTGGSDTGAPDDAIKLDIPAGEDGGGTNVYECSNDLKEVRDQLTGELVTTCGPGEGCFEGVCVPACDAAAGSRGSFGCEYLVATPAFYDTGNPASSLAGPCHALLAVNAWDRPVKLEVSYGGMPLDVASVTRIPDGIGVSTTYTPLSADGIAPGEVAIVFLSHRPGVVNGATSLECPITPAVLADTAASGTGAGTAFEVRTDTPIQLYDILPYGGASTYLPSASLLYPVSAWGTDYLAISPHPDAGTTWMNVVAATDGTTVRVQPTVPLLPGTIADAPVAQVTEYLLDAGQTLQWTSTGDLGGSIITASAPIGVLTGNTSLRVSTLDNPSSGTDSAHQQISDVHSLGNEYVGGGLVSRLDGAVPESVLYRLTGVVDATQLVWDPAPPAGAPVLLNAGQIVEFETRDPFSVRSQDEEHPFSLTQYMSGSLPPTSLGDDDWVVVVPPQQHLSRYPFFVDPTYATSSLVIVREKGPSGFADVNLTCLGAVSGWRPVGVAGKYEVAHVELYRSFAATVPACATSRHEASSELPFGLTVWGTDYYSSYGYPAGGNQKTLNEVDIMPQG